MKLSIIIPVYNMEAYLMRCLNSVLKQDLSQNEYEIICIDDDSCDKSLEILNQYKNQNENIKILVNETNRGQAFSRNRGIEEAKGEYIIFVDADDAIEENKLAEIYDLSKKENLDVLEYSYKEWDVNGDLIIKQVSNNRPVTKVYSGKEYFCLVNTNAAQNDMACVRAYKRTFLNDNTLRFVVGILAEDSLFNFCVYQCASRVLYIEDEIYRYYRRKTSTTKSEEQRLRFWDSQLIISEIIEDFLDKEEDLKYKKIIELYYKKYYRAAAKIYKEISFIPEDYVFGCVSSEKALLAFSIVYNGFFSHKLPQNLLEKLSGYKRIIIYGAGQVGEGLSKLLDERKILNWEMVITNRGNEKYKSIYEIKDKSDVIILVASVLYNADMVNTAKQLGFKDIIDMRYYAEM